MVFCQRVIRLCEPLPIYVLKPWGGDANHQFLPLEGCLHLKQELKKRELTPVKFTKPPKKSINIL